MPVTTIAVGTALGVGGGGLAAGATGAAVLGGAAFGAGKLIGDIVGSGRKSSGGAAPRVEPNQTGILTEEESKDLARKRLFRTGSIFTSPTGVNTPATTTSARLR